MILCSSHTTRGVLFYEMNAGRGAGGGEIGQYNFFFFFFLNNFVFRWFKLRWFLFASR